MGRTLKRTNALARGRGFAASSAQRSKVTGDRCLVCLGAWVDPAHVTPRSLGGCDDPLCVIPLCRQCHEAYDSGELDVLPHMHDQAREELAHAVLHMGLVLTLQQVTGDRWAPAKDTP